jgi:hypothetical protein
MKRIILSISLFVLSIVIWGQQIYYDASAFPLLGKATSQTASRYERLPDSLKTISRKPVWELGRNSTGLAIRFRSNATTISARWSVLYNRNMSHITATNVKGLDLYALIDNGKWRFVNSGRPSGKDNEAVIISNMLPEDREETVVNANKITAVYS